MHVDVQNRVLSLQRIAVLFSILLLFTFIIIVAFFTPTTYADSTKNTRGVGIIKTIPPTLPVTPTPTKIITPSPTPTLPPTPTPTSIPSPTPTPIPTNTPVPTNTPQPTTPPGTTPTPTSTSVAGGPVGTPPATPPAQTTPSPATPPPHATATPGNSGAPPTFLTGTVPSPTATTGDGTTPQTSKPSGLSLKTVLPIGALALVAGVLLAGFIWRRNLTNKTKQVQQQRMVYPVQMSQTGENVAAVFGKQAIPPNGYPVSPGAMDATMPVSDAMYQGQGPYNGYNGPARTPNTPIPSKNTMETMVDPLLEEMMRQAQMGLFAIPGQEKM